MLTKLEAQERASRIWGPRVQKLTRSTSTTCATWYVEVEGDSRLHSFDENGHVSCRHTNCERLEEITCDPFHRSQDDVAVIVASSDPSPPIPLGTRVVCFGGDYEPPAEEHATIIAWDEGSRMYTVRADEPLQEQDDGLRDVSEDQVRPEESLPGQLEVARRRDACGTLLDHLRMSVMGSDLRRWRLPDGTEVLDWDIEYPWQSNYLTIVLVRWSQERAQFQIAVFSDASTIGEDFMVHDWWQAISLLIVDVGDDVSYGSFNRTEDAWNWLRFVAVGCP